MADNESKMLNDLGMEKPRGKEAVKQAIIQSSIKLFAERGVNSVSLRDIALAANVNHGLITRHFGTKEELVKEVGFNLVDNAFRSAVKEGDSFISIWLKGINHNDLRAITRIILDKPDIEVPAGAQKLVTEILNWIKDEQKNQHFDTSIDPIILLFIFGSLIFGGELFGPYIKSVMHLEEDAYQQLKPQIYSILMSSLQEKS